MEAPIRLARPRTPLARPDYTGGDIKEATCAQPSTWRCIASTKTTWPGIGTGSVWELERVTAKQDKNAGGLKLGFGTLTPAECGGQGRSRGVINWLKPFP